MISVMITLLLGTIFGYFGQFLSWIIGGISVFLTLFCALLVVGISLPSIFLLIICVLSYNLGLMITLASSTFQRSFQD